MSKYVIHVYIVRDRERDRERERERESQRESQRETDMINKRDRKNK